MFRLTTALLLLLAGGALRAQEASAIVQQADERARGNTSRASISIRIIRPGWSRDMTVQSWTKGNRLAMIQVTAPARDKGVVYLKKNREVWNWIPAIERNIKLPPSMMSQQWMGTDFTNDDLVKEASIVQDYQHAFAGDTVIADRNCYKIRLLPKPEAAVVWGRVQLFIDRKDLLILRAEYFDEEGQLINTLRAGDVRKLGGRLLPARLEMEPAGKKGHLTVLQYNSLEFDLPLDEAFFSTQNMPRLP